MQFVASFAPIWPCVDCRAVGRQIENVQPRNGSRRELLNTRGEARGLLGMLSRTFLRPEDDSKTAKRYIERPRIWMQLCRNHFAG